MLTTTGIAETSALQILGELAVRAGPAYRLDPRLFKSGESVEKRPRITCSRQSSGASGRGRHAKTAACSVCHVRQQSTVRRIQAVRS